jgi:hypothetical protein
MFALRGFECVGVETVGSVPRGLATYVRPQIDFDAHLLPSAAAVAVMMVLLAPRPQAALATVVEQVKTPDATITVSSSTAGSGLGFTLVEGIMRHRGKVYLLTLRGAQPTSGSTGKVYDLGQARDVEGSYKPAEGGLRNDRGVTIVFDPPLDLSGGQLHVDLSTRVYPKASTGQRGTVD